MLEIYVQIQNSYTPWFFSEKINALNSIFHPTSYVLVLYNLDFVSPNVFWPTTGNLISSPVTVPHNIYR